MFFAMSSALQVHFSRPSLNFSPWYSNMFCKLLSPTFPLRNEPIVSLDAMKRRMSLPMVFSGESFVTMPFSSRRKPQSLPIRVSSLFMPVAFFSSLCIFLFSCFVVVTALGCCCGD